MGRGMSARSRSHLAKFRQQLQRGARAALQAAPHIKRSERLSLLRGLDGSQQRTEQLVRRGCQGAVRVQQVQERQWRQALLQGSLQGGCGARATSLSGSLAPAAAHACLFQLRSAPALVWRLTWGKAATQGTSASRSS